MSKLKKRNGFSLVEVVIALSVIVIVSAAALSIVFSSAATRVNAVNKSRAMNFADNVWECFKAADNEEDFRDLVNFSEGVELTVVEEGKKYTYSSGENKFEAEITVDFEADRDKLGIKVTDEDDDEIISFSYTKGGGV